LPALSTSDSPIALNRRRAGAYLDVADRQSFLRGQKPGCQRNDPRAEHETCMASSS
jgi:hypothetical protein